MYEQKLWQEYVTEFEDRYTESRNDDGTITHTPVENHSAGHTAERNQLQPHGKRYFQCNGNGSTYGTLQSTTSRQ